jgi:hypothetical protein
VVGHEFQVANDVPSEASGQAIGISTERHPAAPAYRILRKINVQLAFNPYKPKKSNRELIHERVGHYGA